MGENWEDSPDGYPQSAPYEWWNWHDAYRSRESSRSDGRRALIDGTEDGDASTTRRRELRLH